MATTQKTAQEITAAISLVSAVIPEVGALITGLRVIWTAANLGKTDADYIGSLGTASGTTTADGAAQLIKDGWVLVNGQWVPPMTQAPPATGS